MVVALAFTLALGDVAAGQARRAPAETQDAEFAGFQHPRGGPARPGEDVHRGPHRGRPPATDVDGRDRDVGWYYAYKIDEACDGGDSLRAHLAYVRHVGTHRSQAAESTDSMPV